jgi:hypothetical protein
VRSELERLRWKLRQNRRIWWAARMMVASGVFTLVGAVLIAAFDNEADWGLKIVSFAAALLVLAYGIAILLFLRSGGAAAEVEPPPGPPAKEEQIARVRRILMMECAALLLIGIVLIAIGATISNVPLEFGGATLVFTGCLMIWRLRKAPYRRPSPNGAP